jgi:hypothetical protein
MAQEAFDTQPQGLERAFLESFPHAQAILRAAVKRAANQRRAAVNRTKGGWAEENEELQKIVHQFKLVRMASPLI